MFVPVSCPSVWTVLKRGALGMEARHAVRPTWAPDVCNIMAKAASPSPDGDDFAYLWGPGSLKPDTCSVVQARKLEYDRPLIPKQKQGGKPAQITPNPCSNFLESTVLET